MAGTLASFAARREIDERVADPRTTQRPPPPLGRALDPHTPLKSEELNRWRH
jgi:hypothetical protein